MYEENFYKCSLHKGGIMTGTEPIRFGVFGSGGYKVEKLYNDGKEYDVAKETTSFSSGLKEIKIGDTTTTINIDGSKAVEKNGTTRYYNANGEFTGSETLKINDNGSTTIYRDENNKVTHSVEEVNGSPEKVITRDANGKVTRKKVTTYYDNGYTRKNAKVYNGDGNLLSEVRYDKNGNKTYSMKTNPYTIGAGRLDGTETRVKNKDGSWNITGVDFEGKTLYTGTEKTRPNGESEHVTKFSDGKVKIEVFDGDDRIFHEDLNGNLISEHIMGTGTYVTRYYKDGKVRAESIREKGEDGKYYKKYYYKGEETTGAGFDEAKRGLRLYYSGLGILIE